MRRPTTLTRKLFLTSATRRMLVTQTTKMQISRLAPVCQDESHLVIIVQHPTSHCYHCLTLVGLIPKSTTMAVPSAKSFTLKVRI